MLFLTVPSATPYGLPFPTIGGSQVQPKIAIAIILGTGKATDCKFGRNIHKKSIKNLREKGVWAYPRTAQIF